MSARIEVARFSRALAIGDAALRGLDLRAYDPARDMGAPALFAGVYQPEDLAAIVEHRGPALVKLCGGDAREAGWFAGVLNALPRPRVRVLAGLPLRADCARHSLRLDIERNVYIGDPSPFFSRPDDHVGRHVYVYCPGARAHEYGIDLIAQVARACPKVPFYVARWGDRPKPLVNAFCLPDWIPPHRLRGFMVDSCCAIRCVARDGFSVGAVECALLGLPVAHVTDMGVPWIRHAPDIGALVAFVRKRTLRPRRLREVAAAARAFVEDRSWLDLPVEAEAEAEPIAPAPG